MFVFRQKWTLKLNFINHQDISHIGSEQKCEFILSARPKVFKQYSLHSVQYAGVCVFQLHTNLHVPTSSISFIIAIKMKVKEHICLAAMLLFHILQKYYLVRHCIFFQVLLPYIILGSRGKCWCDHHLRSLRVQCCFYCV